ncbi:hypothetical protein IU449_00640 [Nocardia higoensis]|uniref:Uncharacterized protein n=1 Tax=Nocardia higoensis TaxID=228599 RepID=A0ABS0D8G8_9NOCA|nr:hypothetical protein [Nocardia higoensis]MBF6353068.1 hypothetical protein [Nocardia higoensis]
MGAIVGSSVGATVVMLGGPTVLDVDVEREIGEAVGGRMFGATVSAGFIVIGGASTVMVAIVA